MGRRTDPQIGLRIPPEACSTLKRQAEQNGRSVTGQTELLLFAALQQAEHGASLQLEAVASRVSHVLKDASVELSAALLQKLDVNALRLPLEDYDR